MRKRHLVAALKNRLDPEQTVALALAVRDAVRPDAADIVGFCPSAAALAWASSCRGDLALAAQNCGWEAAYSLTGELTVRDLQVFSASYCIVGHSERRLHLGETEPIIARRLGALMAAEIIPILCVGETLEERRDGRAVAVIRTQLASVLTAFTASRVAPDPTRIIVAYEPVWAISTAGSNLEAEPRDVVAIHRAIRDGLDDLFGSAFGEATSVIFGGGVDARNAANYLREPEVDGALGGGGMQTAPGFLGMLEVFYACGASEA
jgi:triosephosphate isomerase